MKRISALILLVLAGCSSSVPENSNHVNSILFTGDGERQPLLVGLGGSEGGNAWAGDRWKPTRDSLVNRGYAFLAVGYFGMKGTAGQLDRIAIEAVHDAILEAQKDPKVDAGRVAIIGGSKGAELALLLASYYPDIKCVVALVPGNCAFPALTLAATTSSWTLQGEEVPFVPMPWAAVPSALKHDLRQAFTIMLQDTAAVEKALIPVEKINGPVLLLSATRDEMWPSTEMSNAMMQRLTLKHFSYPYVHKVIEGGHTDVLDHFDLVIDFLQVHFPV